MNILKIIVGIICLFGSVSWAGAVGCAASEGEGACQGGTLPMAVSAAAKKAQEYNQNQ